MKRACVRWCGIVALVAALGACSSVTTPPASLQFSLTESGTLGYEVDDEGVITITSRQMQFRSRAGEPGRTLTSYRIQFRDGAGAGVNGGDDTQIGSMSLYVPAGIQCTTPNEVTGCTLASEGAVFGPGQVAMSQPYNLLPGEIAIAHLAAGSPVEWHALIRFEGIDARGIEFTTVDYQVAIAPPD